MHAVLVAGVILTPLHALALLIADGWGGVRHPLDLRRREDPAVAARARRGWRAWYVMDRVQRVYWRLGFAAGLACLCVAGIVALARL